MSFHQKSLVFRSIRYEIFPAIDLMAMIHYSNLFNLFEATTNAWYLSPFPWFYMQISTRSHLSPMNIILVTPSRYISRASQRLTQTTHV